MTDPHDGRPDTPRGWSGLVWGFRERKLVQWTLAYAAAVFAVRQLVDIQRLLRGMRLD